MPIRLFAWLAKTWRSWQKLLHGRPGICLGVGGLIGKLLRSFVKENSVAILTLGFWQWKKPCGFPSRQGSSNSSSHVAHQWPMGSRPHRTIFRHCPWNCWNILPADGHPVLRLWKQQRHCANLLWGKVLGRSHHRLTWWLSPYGIWSLDVSKELIL